MKKALLISAGRQVSKELIEKYVDQIDFEKLEVPPRLSKKNKNEDNINSSD